MSESHLNISQVSIDFPTPNGPFRALDKVDLKIEEGEFVSLIGHSGCGKSTVLNIVAGLYHHARGDHRLSRSCSGGDRTNRGCESTRAGTQSATAGRL